MFPRLVLRPFRLPFHPRFHGASAGTTTSLTPCPPTCGWLPTRYIAPLCRLVLVLATAMSLTPPLPSPLFSGARFVRFVCMHVANAVIDKKHSSSSVLGVCILRVTMLSNRR